MKGRLEDLQRDWQQQCADLLSGHKREILDRLREGATDPVADLKAQQNLAEQLLSRCVGWLLEHGNWSVPPEAEARVRADLSAALHGLPALPTLPELTRVELSVWSQALAAAVGALLGMLLLTPLSLLLLGQREAGLFLGGTLGAAILSAALGWLAHHPNVRAVLAGSLGAAAVGSFIAGLWGQCRGRSNGLLPGSLFLFCAAMLVLLSRPRLCQTDGPSLARAYEPLVSLHLERVADLILAWCWAHPDQTPIPTQPPVNPGSLPGPVWDALADLRLPSAAATTSVDELRSAIEDVNQRLEEQGYRWHGVPHGTPFDEQFKKQFDTFGLIPAGTPVRTRRPALILRDQLIRRGELRRV